MSKTKKFFVSLTAILLAYIIGFGVWTVFNHYKKISKTGLCNAIPYGFGKEATVILLAGQSNAAGCSKDEYLKKKADPEKYAEYEKGYEHIYINYFTSGTNQSDGFVKAKVRQGEFGEYFGPELGLAEKLHELHPEKNFFIIKYAWGGTNLCEQWRSPSSGQAGPLYNSFFAFAKNSIEYLKVRGYKVKIEGMCWMQGEADSMQEESTLNYGRHLSNFIQDIRSELTHYASNDGIAFVDAYIADSFFWKYYIQLNEEKQKVANSAPNNVVIDTIAHGLSILEEPEGEPDIAHYDSLSEIKLGNLFAEEISKFLD